MMKTTQYWRNKSEGQKIEKYSVFIALRNQHSKDISSPEIDI